MNPDVVERDLRANIKEWPAKVRYKGRPISMDCNSSAALSTVLGGGLLDDDTITLTGPRADFGKRVPEARDDIELQLRNGSWKLFEITNVPDGNDPISPILTLVIGSPDK